MIWNWLESRSVISAKSYFSTPVRLYDSSFSSNTRLLKFFKSSSNRIVYLCKENLHFLFFKMTFGNTIKKNLAMCFYDRNQTHVLDVNRLLAIIVAIFAIGSIFLFALLEAENARDYVISAFVFAAVFGIFISFIDTSIKTTKIFSLFDANEKIIEKSKDLHLASIHF